MADTPKIPMAPTGIGFDPFSALNFVTQGLGFINSVEDRQAGERFQKYTANEALGSLIYDIPELRKGAEQRFEAVTDIADITRGNQMMNLFSQAAAGTAQATRATRAASSQRGFTRQGALERDLGTALKQSEISELFSRSNIVDAFNQAIQSATEQREASFQQAEAQEQELRSQLAQAGYTSDEDIENLIRGGGLEGLNIGNFVERAAGRIKTIIGNIDKVSEYYSNATGLTQDQFGDEFDRLAKVSQDLLPGYTTARSKGFMGTLEEYSSEVLGREGLGQYKDVVNYLGVRSNTYGSNTPSNQPSFIDAANNAASAFDPTYRPTPTTNTQPSVFGNQLTPQEPFTTRPNTFDINRFLDSRR